MCFLFKLSAPTISPSNLQILCLTDTKVSLTWTPPPLSSLNGKIIMYTVTYKKSNGKNLKSCKTDQDKIEILDLKPFTKYLIQVAACNFAGCGPASSSLSVTTLESGKKVFYGCHEFDIQF